MWHSTLCEHANTRTSKYVGVTDCVDEISAGYEQAYRRGRGYAMSKLTGGGGATL